MMRRSLDIDWVTDRLAIGGSFPVDAAEQLAEHYRIDRVVDLRAEGCDEELSLRRHGILFLYLPTEDRCAVARDMIHEGVTWVSAALDGGHRVLIHCEHGIGRSALLAVAVLIRRGSPPLVALELAKRSRDKVSPSPEQLHALLAYAREVRDTQGAHWELPSFEDLAHIAYRHLAGEEAPR